MSSTALKLSIAAAFAAIGSAINVIMLPFCVLCVLMVADYVTGMVKSWQAGTLSSRTGTVGLVKKLCYGLAVIAAAGVDYVIVYGASLAGKEFSYRAVFVLLVIAWLAINECISILENLSEIGVPLPQPLIKVAKRLKIDIEKKGESGDVGE